VSNTKRMILPFSYIYAGILLFIVVDFQCNEKTENMFAKVNFNPEFNKYEAEIFNYL